MCPYMFDFTFEKPTLQYTPMLINQEEGTQSVPSILERNNLCPYPIPTIAELLKDIEKVSYTVGAEKFLSDLFECGAIALSNQVDKTHFTEREERFNSIMESYGEREKESMQQVFGKVYALLSSVVYDDGVFDDYLGELFMRANAGNKHAGQYFTPYHVSKMMAKMTMQQEISRIKQNADEIITVNDCCCGGGGMLIAALDVFRENKINYTRNCFVDAGDIDARCVHMTYLQLSLAGVPAIVRHQNALTRELLDVWYTPAFIFQYLRFCKYVNLN